MAVNRNGRPQPKGRWLNMHDVIEQVSREEDELLYGPDRGIADLMSEAPGSDKGGSEVDILAAEVGRPEEIIELPAEPAAEAFTE